MNRVEACTADLHIDIGKGEHGMPQDRHSIGIALIAVAVFLLLGKLGFFQFLGALFWPVIILAAGVVLHLLYFGRSLPAVALIPGGILITYSIMFLVCNLFSWHLMTYIWPGFIFGVAVGLYEFHLYDRYAPGGVLTAAIVLAIISAALFGMTLIFALGVYFIALGLLAAGIVLIVRRPKMR